MVRSVPNVRVSEHPADLMTMQIGGQGQDHNVRAFGIEDRSQIRVGTDLFSYPELTATLP